MDLGPILRAMGRNKVRFGLIAIEIALTLAIVANCVNMILDARRQMARASGFDDDHLMRVWSQPFDPAFKEQGYRDNAVQKDMETMRAISGVKAVTNSSFLPWQGGGSSDEMRASGSKGQLLRTQIYATDETMLETLGVKIVEGRNLTKEEVQGEIARTRARRTAAQKRERDAEGRVLEPFTQNALVSRAYARLAFKDGSAVGKMLEDSDGDLYLVVGVFDPFYNPYGWPIHEYAVLYPNESVGPSGAFFLVRTEPGAEKTVFSEMEKRLLAVNNGRNLRLNRITDVKENFFATQNAVATLMSVVIALLVFVTSLGIVGLTSFSVSERTRHIGTRRALGARKADILRYFLAENWLVTTLGLCLGLVLTYGLNFLLAQSTNGPKLGIGLVGAGVVLLWAAGLAAALVPALRGASVSPAVATRNV